jgi:hypothetical protein
MECPHCHEKIAGRECTRCGRDVPEESLYCMYCGADLKKKDASSPDEDSFDFENRVLCPDGSCTGIIVDGKCTVCGKAG